MGQNGRCNDDAQKQRGRTHGQPGYDVAFNPQGHLSGAEIVGDQNELIVNKNPYHTVRLAWLKATFPKCFIVCTLRRAVPNIFSLLKKHVRTDEWNRPWREDAWYGVKPRYWRDMLDDDLVTQCTNQWCHVMRKLCDDQSLVDLFVGYRQLCESPGTVLQQILRRGQDRRRGAERGARC